MLLAGCREDKLAREDIVCVFDNAYNRDFGGTTPTQESVFSCTNKAGGKDKRCLRSR
ncbi:MULTISPECIES: hypothetical protein [Helicobacter]|uniref:Lipoprotein n=2 Tax=Helicobacter TaxID=209 RepID=A0ABZ3F4P1_9HELI|nr:MULTISPECIES: hypothetical protein [Helicobacter]